MWGRHPDVCKIYTPVAGACACVCVGVHGGLWETEPENSQPQGSGWAQETGWPLVRGCKASFGGFTEKASCRHVLQKDSHMGREGIPGGGNSPGECSEAGSKKIKNKSQISISTGTQSGSSAAKTSRQNTPWWIRAGPRTHVLDSDELSEKRGDDSLFPSERP